MNKEEKEIYMQICKYDKEPKEVIADLVNLIQKQEKIINNMAEKINQAYFDEENMYIWFEEKILPKDEFGLCDYKDLGTRKTRIKEYFKKEVEKECNIKNGWIKIGKKIICSHHLWKHK